MTDKFVTSTVIMQQSLTSHLINAPCDMLTKFNFLRALLMVEVNIKAKFSDRTRRANFNRRSSRD